MNRAPTFFLLFFGIMAPAIDYRIETDSRLQYHVHEPVELSSHRHGIDTDVKAGLTRTLSFVAGARAFADGSPHPSTGVSEEIRAKEIYLQHKSGSFSVRLGNQQVVWGEAFGFYYADLINPKDLREFGLGPVDKNRVSIPMLTMKYIFSDVSLHSSLQAVFIPRSYFNLTPLRGDFAFPFNRFFQGLTTSVTDTSSAPLGSENFEGGIRFSTLLAGIDLSLIGFSYLDRSPHYESSFSSATIVQIHSVHRRLNSVGLTTLAPCLTFFCRTEVLFHQDRLFDTIEGTNLHPEESHEMVGVFGIDYTQSDRFRLGLQVAENFRIKEMPGALLKRSRQNLSLQVRFNLFRSHVFENLLTYAPHDGSCLLQSSYLVPLANNIEWITGADLFWGNGDSEFGSFEKASRVGTRLKLYLNSGS